MSMAGKMRFSARRRSRNSSQLPVPLNSSKITSSMRLPVSMRQVAIMVRLPPSSMLRAAPNSRLEGCEAAGERAAAGRQGQVVGAGQARDAVQEDQDVPPALHQSPRPLYPHLGHPRLLLDGVVEGSGQDLRLLHGAPPVRDLLRPLTDQEDDDVYVLVVVGDGVGDHLEEDGLARLRRGDDEPALAAADGGDEVDEAGGGGGGGGPPGGPVVWGDGR